MNITRFFPLPRRVTSAGFIVAVGLGLVLLWWINHPPPLDHVAAPAALAAKFEETVFGRDFRADVTRVYKWKGPYLIRIHNPFPRFLRMNLGRHAEILEEITGLEFTVTPRPTDANVELYFIPDGVFPSIAQKFKPTANKNRKWLGAVSCFMITDGNPSGRSNIISRYTITRGVIGISATLPRKETESCLLEELYQGLGPGKNSNALPPSISSIWDTQTELSLNDKIILRALYDARITPGMPRAEAMAIAREVIAGLVAAVKQKGEAALIHPRYRRRPQDSGK